jgi:hypothetical protein
MEVEMRKWLIAIVMVVGSISNSGCIIPIWSPNPDDRARQLIYTSESYRHIPEIWERIWGLDLPDLATPYRTHGGVI